MPNLISRFDGKLECKICSQSLQVGDKAWRHYCPRKRTSYTEYYCLMCYTKLWIQ